MEFIKKYEIQQPELIVNEDLTHGLSGSINAFVKRVCCISVETFDGILFNEVIKVAKEQGITDLYLLDKTNILDALSKQIPRAERDGCPRCHYDLSGQNYCPYCGQKILMDPETGYPVREE